MNPEQLSDTHANDVGAVSSGHPPHTTPHFGDKEVVFCPNHGGIRGCICWKLDSWPFRNHLLIIQGEEEEGVGWKTEDKRKCKTTPYLRVKLLITTTTTRYKTIYFHILGTLYPPSNSSGCSEWDFEPDISESLNKVISLALTQPGKWLKLQCNCHSPSQIFREVFSFLVSPNQPRVGRLPTIVLQCDKICLLIVKFPNLLIYVNI